jgi:hypothetical protein
MSHNLQHPENGTPERILVTPEWAPTDRKTVCVDECIADAVQAIWDAGVWTLGSCCGHNNLEMRGVIVEQADKAEAIRLLEGIDPTIRVGAWQLVFSAPPHQQ